MQLSIKNVRRVPEAQPGTAGEKNQAIAYPSPDGQRVLWVESLGEFRMGQQQCRLRLGKQGELPSAAPALQVPGKEQARLGCPQLYQPWTWDSRSIAVLVWGSPLVLLDLQTHVARPIPISGYALTALCSPQLPVAFFSTADAVCFVPLADLKPRKLALSPQHSWAAWLGERLLFLQQEPKHHRSTLLLLDPATGAPVAQTDISPDRLLPWDSARIRALKVGGYRSVARPMSWGPAFHSLDVWTNVRYSPESRTLRMRVFRPAGEPERRFGRLQDLFQFSYTIPVTRETVEVELTSDV